MIPLYDNVPPSRKPIVNWVLIGICTVVWLLQLATKASGSDLPGLVFELAMIPARVLDPGGDHVMRVFVTRRDYYEIAVGAAAIPDWLTPLTCTFLHGGWMHFLGNMWFLWIFGDNVEDRLGKAGYVGFYLGCGVAASLAHLLSNLDSAAPTVGASGAIAGVMGAYILLYPHARVLTLVPLGFVLTSISLPAFVFLGIWLALQFFNVLGAGGGATGVAWWAHIGGFGIGALVILALKALGKLKPPVRTIRPGSDQMLYRIQRRRF